MPLVYLMVTEAIHSRSPEVLRALENTIQG